MEIIAHGILRYPHIFQPSAPRGTTERRYSAEILIAKSDTEQVARIQQAVDAEKQAGFPNGMPRGAILCFTDMALDPDNDPRLHQYYSLSMSTPETSGAPEVVDMNRQPIMNPGQVQAGMMVYAGGNTKHYNVGQAGVKCYLNAVMVTDQQGNIDPALLSSRPTASSMFANLPGAGPSAPGAPAGPSTPAAATPQYVMTPAAQGFTRDQYIAQGWTDQGLIDAGMMQAPAAPAAPPAAPAAPPAAGPQYVMTDKAQGFTRDQYRVQGWTDEALIEQGMMLPPGGVKPTFVS